MHLVINWLACDHNYIHSLSFPCFLSFCLIAVTYNHDYMSIHLVFYCFFFCHTVSAFIILNMSVIDIYVLFSGEQCRNVRPNHKKSHKWWSGVNAGYQSLWSFLVNQFVIRWALLSLNFSQQSWNYKKYWKILKCILKADIPWLKCFFPLLITLEAKVYLDWI